MTGEKKQPEAGLAAIQRFHLWNSSERLVEQQPGLAWHTLGALVGASLPGSGENPWQRAPDKQIITFVNLYIQSYIFLHLVCCLFCVLDGGQGCASLRGATGSLACQDSHSANRILLLEAIKATDPHELLNEAMRVPPSY